VFIGQDDAGKSDVVAPLRQSLRIVRFLDRWLKA
jgi:hypothetical protein